MPVTHYTRLCAGLAVLLSVSDAQARGRVDFNDIEHAPRPFLDTLRDTLLEMVDELGLSDELQDMVVVGSFAYGIARLADPTRPSDLDIVIYTRVMAPDPTRHMEGVSAFREATQRYAPLIRKRLDIDLRIDIKADTRDVEDHISDPDWVGYSLLHREFYNRDDGLPRRVKGHFFENVYYVFEREAFSAYLARIGAEQTSVLQRLDGNQLVFYDKQAWDKGQRVELLRSFPKVPGKRSDLTR